MKTRIKKFYADNRSDILFWTMVVGSTAAVGAIYVYAWKVEQQFAEQLNDFVIEQNRLGNSVVELADGSFVAIKYPE